MYSMFCLIFLIFVVDSVILRHQFEDEHPFTTDDDNAEKTKVKFMLIPSIGYETNDKPGKFTLILNGWYYKPLNSSSLQSSITYTVQIALHFLDHNENFSEEEKEERLGPFFVRDVDNYKIQLKLSKTISKIVTTNENGRFHEKITIDSLEGLNIKGHKLKYIASDNTHPEQEDEGIIYLMKNDKHHRCSIISDIDDTIKISEVPSKRRLIVNTFKKDFRAVPGMSELYRSWQSSHKCLIHYVSAMPSQLYYVTQKFLNKEKFPGGSFHMRHLKLVNEDNLDLITKIIEFAQHDASKIHKLSVIKNIFEHAPLPQEFVMVGDSGELDPEIYGEIARSYPNRIKMIFIRLVDGGKNDNDRFETAFKDVPNDKWSSFSNADELPQKLYENDDPINVDNDSDIINNAIILSMSLFYNILSIFFTMIYV